MFICELIPKSPFVSEINSNTLFGAICWGIKRLFGKSQLIQFLDLYNKENKFPLKISSLFPLIGTSYYIPIPNYPIVLEFDSVDEKTIERFTFEKKINKLKFLSHKIYNRFSSNFSWNEIFNSNDVSLRENYLMTIEEEKKFPEDKVHEEIVRQKNRINRLSGTTSGEGALYFIKEMHFQDPLKFYFIYDISENEVLTQEKFESILKYLGDEGLGGERTYGYGMFNVKFSREKPFKLIENFNYVEILSYYFPNFKNGEIKKILVNKNNYTKIFYRKAKIESSERSPKRIYKKGAFFIDVGSLIQVNQMVDMGMLVDVTPPNHEHNIYEYGIPILMPFNIKEVKK